MFRTLVGAATALLLSAGVLTAQNFPERELLGVIMWGAGGATDVVARGVTPAVEEALGKPIVMLNKAGGAGAISVAYVHAAPADGYTLLYGTPGPLITNRFLMESLPYDPDKDFAPVSLLTKGAYLMAVNKDVPARTVAEIIVLARAHPGELTFASSGIGAGSHLAGELLCIEAGIRMSHVPYRGTGQALQDVASGRVSMSIDTYGPMIPLIQAGKLRPIAVTSARRMPDLPDVPTIAETIPGYEVTVVNYICVRSGTPRPIIDRLNQALVRVLAEPSLLERMRAAGSSPPVSSTPEELGDILRSEVAKWGEVIRKAGIRAG